MDTVTPKTLEKIRNAVKAGKWDDGEPFDPHEASGFVSPSGVHNGGGTSYGDIIRYYDGENALPSYYR